MSYPDTWEPSTPTHPETQVVRAVRRAKERCAHRGKLHGPEQYAHYPRGGPSSLPDPEPEQRRKRAPREPYAFERPLPEDHCPQTCFLPHRYVHGRCRCGALAP